jgi:hypothetical protein
MKKNIGIGNSLIMDKRIMKMQREKIEKYKRLDLKSVCNSSLLLYVFKMMKARYKIRST